MGKGVGLPVDWEVRRVVVICLRASGCSLLL